VNDADGLHEKIRGLGVVGHQPLLKPGEQFEYTSGDRIRNAVARIHHLNHANAGRRNLHVTNQEWNDRLTDGSAAEHHHPRGAGGARSNERVVYRHKGAIVPPASRACGHA